MTAPSSQLFLIYITCLPSTVHVSHCIFEQVNLQAFIFRHVPRGVLQLTGWLLLFRRGMLYLCHTAYLSPEAASLHSGSLGHHDPSPIFMHNFSSMIAEYRSDFTSNILTDERLCMSWHFLICIWIKSISNWVHAPYLGFVICCVVTLLLHAGFL